MLPEASVRAADSLPKTFFRYWRKTGCLDGELRLTEAGGSITCHEYQNAQAGVSLHHVSRNRGCKAVATGWEDIVTARRPVVYASAANSPPARDFAMERVNSATS